MGALETNSVLEFLVVDAIGDRQACQSLMRGIPKMTVVKRLMCDAFGIEDFDTRDLIQALKRNRSVLEFGGLYVAGHLDEYDKTKLRYYAARNKYLPMLVESPHDTPPWCVTHGLREIP